MVLVDVTVWTPERLLPKAVKTAGSPLPVAVRMAGALVDVQEVVDDERIPSLCLGVAVPPVGGATVPTTGGGLETGGVPIVLTGMGVLKPMRGAESFFFLHGVGGISAEEELPLLRTTPWRAGERGASSTSEKEASIISLMSSLWISAWT